ERFKEISEAYNVLSDAKHRKEYDDARSLFGSGGYRPPGQGGAGGFPFDLGDLFGGGGTGTTTTTGSGGRLGDLLGRMFGGRGPQQSPAPAAARDGHRDRGDAVVQRRHRRHHGVAAADG